jgi:hypothetical protein
MAPEERDELLREALAGYSAPEPPLGMEQRVLHRIAASRRYPAWRLPACAFAVLAAAVVLTVMLTPPHEDALTPLNAPVAPPVVVEASVPVADETAVKRVVKRHPVTRPREFPSRTPLTKEERALLALLSRAPDQAAEILVATEPTGITQLAIADLEIPPLGE